MWVKCGNLQDRNYAKNSCWIRRITTTTATQWMRGATIRSKTLTSRTDHLFRPMHKLYEFPLEVVGIRQKVMKVSSTFLKTAFLYFFFEFSIQEYLLIFVIFHIQCVCVSWNIILVGHFFPRLSQLLFPLTQLQNSLQNSKFEKTFGESVWN